MATTTLVFFAIYLICLLGSVFYHPLLGVIGYSLTYNLSPASQWWGQGLASMGLRFSFFMAVAIAVGMYVHRDKLDKVRGLHKQEVLFLLMVIWIFITGIIGLPGAGEENFGIKLLKVFLFLWMATRIVTSVKNYEIFLWILLICGMSLGYEALGASTAFYGRLDRGVGGSDFAEGNFLAAHFAMLLPFAGVFFIKGTVKQKIVILAAAVLMVNGIVLCRSRGVFLALFLGVAAAIYFAPKGWRSKIVAVMIVGMLGSLSMVDQGFIDRMRNINVDVGNVEEQDASAAGRILAWKAAIQMGFDHPLGIGQDNFVRYVGNYQPSIPHKDTHNTFLRTFAELGFPGAIILLMMIWNAFKVLRQQKKRAEGTKSKKEIDLHVYGLTVSLIIFLAAGMFVTHTYIEELYWLLLLPVMFERAVTKEIISENTITEDTLSESLDPIQRGQVGVHG